MSGKIVAAIMIPIFVLFAVGVVSAVIYVHDQTARCASIGAAYDGPGVCKFTQERRVPTP